MSINQVNDILDKTPDERQIRGIRGMITGLQDFMANAGCPTPKAEELLKHMYEKLDEAELQNKI